VVKQLEWKVDAKIREMRQECTRSANEMVETEMLRLQREAAKGEQDIRQRYSAVRMAARQGREEVEEEKKRAVQEEEVKKVKNKLEAMKSKLDAVAGKVEELGEEVARLRSLEEEVLSLRGKALRMVANLKAKEEEVNKLQRTMDRQAEGKKKKEGEEAGGGGAEHGDSTATMYRVAKGLEEILLDMTRAMP